MKISALFSVLFICFVMISCGADDEEGGSAGGAGAPCVTVVDCPDGYVCIDSTCQQQSSKTDDSESKTDNGNSSGLPSDNIKECPNACSGYGECDLDTGICTCSENHGEEDCSGCTEGYHLESEDVDEDGDPSVRSCVPNKTCDPDPCNGGKCTAMESTVKCECVNHTAGAFCEDCEENYLKSAVDGKCKPGCDGGYTCAAPQKCGIDFDKNEATCNQCENEFYSGSDCTSCDPVHFCGEHGKTCKVEGGTEKCTCENGYILSNNKCIKECKPEKCFKTRQCEAESMLGGTTTGIAVAYGTCNPTTGNCDCEPGWVTGNSEYGVGTPVNCTNLIRVLETFNNVECALCDQSNPPSQYAKTGCPAECPAMFCSNAVMLDTLSGSCYYENGTNKIYCECESGYTMSGNGSKYHTDNPTGMCGSSE